MPEKLSKPSKTSSETHNTPLESLCDDVLDQLSAATRQAGYVSEFHHLRPTIALKLNQNGHSIPDIARFYRCSQDTVRERLRKAGVALTKRLRPDISDDAIIQKHQAGCTRSEMAEYFGCHPNTIGARLRGLNKVSSHNRYDVTIDDIVPLIHARLSINKIATSLECSSDVVRTRLSKAGIEYNPNKPYQHFEKIRETYREIGTVDGTAKHLGIGLAKVIHAVSGEPTSRPHRHRTDITFDKVVQLMQEHQNTREVARLMGCSQTTVLAKLYRAGYFKRTTKIRKDVPEGRVLEDFDEGQSCQALAKKYSCSRQVIVRIVQSNGRVPCDNYRSDIPVERICNEYHSGRSIAALAEEYNCNTKTITTKLLDAGEKLRTIKEQKRIDFGLTEELEKHIVSLSATKSLAQIIREVGLGKNMVTTILKERNIMPAKPYERNDLDQKQLVKEYATNQLSIVAIARKYNCSISAVSDRLKAAGVEIRDFREQVKIDNVRRYAARPGKGNAEPLQ